MRTFADLTSQEIIDILNLAMDDGEWHTPSASDISIHTQTKVVAYGRCNISKHNTYHYVEHWFNINSNTVKIWKEEYVRNRANIHHIRAIYNLKKLGELLESLTEKQPL